MTNKVLLKPEDFEVEECLVQFYQRNDLVEPGYSRKQGWWWYCFTCEDATGKHVVDGRRKKLRLHGHNTEADALCGATMHAKQKKKNRQWQAWYEWWWSNLMNTTDVEFFGKLWNQQYGFRNWEERTRTDMTPEEKMQHMQQEIHTHTLIRRSK